MKSLMIGFTDRNFINPDNYEFYFKKRLTKRGIEIQVFVLKMKQLKPIVKNRFQLFLVIISTAIMLYNYMAPDNTVRAAVLMTAVASTMLNRTKTLINCGFGKDIMFIISTISIMTTSLIII